MERQFYDREDDNFVTEAELREQFCELLKYNPTDYSNISFEDYVLNCLDKNGFLEEVKPISETEVAEIKSKAELLWEAFKGFYECLENVAEESFNESIAEDYPFADSFESAYWHMYSWLVNVCDNANKLCVIE